MNAINHTEAQAIHATASAAPAVLLEAADPSKNKANATKLLEYLSDVPAQEVVSNENYEFPVNPKAKPAELLRSWGTFKTQQISFAELGKNNAAAIALMGKTGWK